MQSKSRIHPNFKIIIFFNLPYILTTVILYWRFGVTEIAKLKWWATAVVNTIFVIKIVVYIVTQVINCKLNQQSFVETITKEIKSSWQVKEVQLLFSWVKRLVVTLLDVWVTKSSSSKYEEPVQIVVATPLTHVDSYVA